MDTLCIEFVLEDTSLRIRYKRQNSAPCNGILMYLYQIFIAIASILAAFNIEKSIDASGMPITPAEDYVSSIVR